MVLRSLSRQHLTNRELMKAIGKLESNLDLFKLWVGRRVHTNAHYLGSL